MTAATAALFLLLNPTAKPAIPASKSCISLSAPLMSRNSLPHPSPPPLLLRRSSHRFQPRSAAVQDAAVAEEEAVQPAEEGIQEDSERKRKLYVVNLPFNVVDTDIGKLFGECGTVNKVELIKKDGKNRGFAFVTMATAEEAHAALNKFDSHELQGRIIRVEFSKSFRKPSPPPAPRETVVEIRHKIYASNLAWRVRSANLREFFSTKFKPLSARVVFDARKAAGYGFVAFSTKEEAESAVSELDGKELMGRPIRLRLSEKNGDEFESGLGDTNSTEGQSEES